MFGRHVHSERSKPSSSTPRDVRNGASLARGEALRLENGKKEGLARLDVEGAEQIHDALGAFILHV